MKKKTTNSQQGFTLLEILVVLTIMGFLIAMVAPRLAGISSGASGTVCDTSKERIKTYMGSFYESFNRYPNYLTNLVMSDGATLDAANTGETGYQIPYCSDDNPDNGPEVIAYGHNKLYKFMIHRLSKEEADELISLGITSVYNLNDYSAEADGLNGGAAFGRQHTPKNKNDDRVSNWANITEIANKRPFMELCPVKAGVGVAMCGCGMKAAAGTEVTYLNSERGWAEEDIFARIVFGLGPESELVKSGIVSNAAHCPGSIQNADNFSSGHYYLILPRLSATAQRLKTATLYAGLWGPQGLTYQKLEDMTALSWEKEGPKPSPGYDFGINDKHFKIRVGINLGEAMEPWDYDTNRHRYDEVWGLDISADGSVLQGG